MAFAFNDNGSKAEISVRNEDFNRNTYSSCIVLTDNRYTIAETANISVRNNVVQVYLPIDTPFSPASSSWNIGFNGEKDYIIKFKSPYTPTKNYAILRILGLIKVGPNSKPAYKEIGTLWVQSDGHTLMYFNENYNNKRIYIEGTYIIN